MTSTDTHVASRGDLLAIEVAPLVDGRIQVLAEYHGGEGDRILDTIGQYATLAEAGAAVATVPMRWEE